MRDSFGTLRLLEETLEAMFMENEKITTRAVIARMGGVLKHPSDITRNDERDKLFLEYKDRQQRVRTTLKARGAKSAQNLTLEVVKLSDEIAQLRSEKELLIASHRAAILAVGELGGAPAWLRFFERYKASVERLDAIGAVPRNVVDIRGHS